MRVRAAWRGKGKTMTELTEILDALKATHGTDAGTAAAAGAVAGDVLCRPKTGGKL